MSLLYKGFFLFYDEVDQKMFTATNVDDQRNVISYRLGDPAIYDLSGTTIDIISEYNTARVQTAFGLFLETDGTDLTYQFQHSDDGISYTDLIAATAIDETKKVHVEVSFDFTTEITPSESHKFWRIRINNPSQVAVTIRQAALGEGIFFERGFNVGQAVPGFDQSIKAVGQPQSTGMPLGRKYYNRRVNFTGTLSLLSENSSVVRSFWTNYNIKPVFLVWNMSTKYYRPMLLYRKEKKKHEKYDTLVTNNMIVSGRGYV